MFGITDRIRSAATAGGLVAVAGTLALVGLIWITIAAFTVLALYLPPAAAMLTIGLALMLPLFVVILQHRGKPKASEPAPAAQQAGEFLALAQLAGSARSLSEKSPIAGAALALGAAYFASRSPATSALAMQIIAEVINQWAAKKDDDKPADETPEK